MPLKNENVENAIPNIFVSQIRNKAALAKLNALAKDTIGLFLVVLVRTDHRMVELHPTGGDEGLPHFCQVYRSTERGKKRCLTCRSLVAFAARYRGLIEYTCHGGISVVAAPAVRANGAVSEHIVVVACAFAQGSHERGWKAASKHGKELEFDLAPLKTAYFELPPVTDKKLRLARGLVDAAAAMLGEVEERIACEYGGEGRDAQKPAPEDRLDLAGFAARLVQSRDKAFKPEGEVAGSALADLVIAMVKRDPTMHFSVSNIARAACITPNHFSTLFHKHTGQTFRDFLTQERITFSRALLSDPSVSIVEVARRSGFDDPAYFSRRFKQVIGIPPSQWRNNRAAIGPESARPAPVS